MLNSHVSIRAFSGLRPAVAVVNGRLAANWMSGLLKEKLGRPITTMTRDVQKREELHLVELMRRLRGGQPEGTLEAVGEPDDHSTVEYGKNLVGVLDYLSPQKPPLKVFRTREWLVRTRPGWSNAMDVAWYLPIGFRTAKARLEVVGHV
jgi:hypothetical protein